MNIIRFNKKKSSIGTALFAIGLRAERGEHIEFTGEIPLEVAQRLLQYAMEAIHESDSRKPDMLGEILPIKTL